MRSPARAIAWQLVARYRWWLLAGGVYFLVAAALCQLMPGGPAFHGVRLYLVLPLMGAPIGVMVVFILGAESDLASWESLFPGRMFVLPVATRGLAGWPMLYGTTAIWSTWVAVAFFALRTVWPDMPVWWPAWLLAAGLAWFQALAWVPFGLRLLRVVAALAGVGGNIGILLAVHLANPPALPLVVVFAAQIPAAYAVAVMGLAYARRGDGPNWEWLLQWIRAIGARCAVRRRAFRSASHAQFWFEWRMYGLGLPLVVGVMLPVPTAVILLHNYSSRVQELPVLLQPGILLAIPLLAAMTSGPGFGGFISRAGGSAASSFLATRPLSCAEFVAAKFKMALLSVVATYALVLPVTIGVIAWKENYGRLIGGVHRWIGPTSAWGTAAIFVVAILLLLAAAWKLLAGNLFVGLTGRKWVLNAVCIGMLPLFYAFLSLGWWISMQPENYESLLASVPWLLGLLVGLKLLLAGWVMRALVRRRLLGSAAIARLAGLWLAAVAVVGALAIWQVPPGVLPWYVVSFCVVLAVPLARIGLAPLALAWNRHR